MTAKKDYQHILRRSTESRDHLQNLLERSDQKAGFVVTGIAFLALFVEQGNFNAWVTVAALNLYGLAFICVCITALPRKWGWYRARGAEELYKVHLRETLEQEVRQNTRQESDLRGIYRHKYMFLTVGFVFLIAGMVATQLAVIMKYA